MNFIFKLLLSCIIFLSLVTFAYANENLRFEIQGVEGDLLKNVQTRLKVVEESYGAELTVEEIHKFYKQAPQEIRKAVEPYGYFQPIVQSNLNQRGSTWNASFQIKLGSPIRIAEIHLRLSGDGENNPQLKKIFQTFPVKTGEIFHSEIYENAKEELFKTANNQGYIKAVLKENKVLIDLKKNKALVYISFETGPRYYFGPITFESNPYTPVFLRRFMRLNENMPFSSEKLLTLQQDMATSFYFKQVLITPDFNNIRDYKVPLNVTVTAPKAQKYSLGLGYGTFTGPRITAGVSFRRIGHEGQHFDTQVKFSKILSTLGVKYYIPGSNPLTDQWVFGASYQKFKPKNGVSNSGNLTAGYLKKINHFQLNTNLNYLIDRYQVKNESKRFSKLLYPSFNATYVKTDDPINPLFGQSFYFNLQGASQYLLSSTTFMQAEIRGKYLFSPASFSHFLVRGDLGYTFTREIKNLPFSMGFFAGGLNSIRGYPESSIGPGKYLKVASIEYQNKIYGNWNGAIFYDVGVASKHFNKPLLRGEGFGIIYNSLIGPVKVYVGRAMSKPGKPHSFELSIGPEF